MSLTSVRVKGLYDESYYVNMCKEVEERIDDFVSSDVSVKVNTLYGYYMSIKSKMPYMLYVISSPGAVIQTKFKAISLALFNKMWLGTGKDVMIDLNTYDPNHLNNHIRALDLIQPSIFHDKINYVNASATPLAFKVLSSIRSYYSKLRDVSKFGSKGLRIIVSGGLGSGKTTFVFYSVYSVLRLLKFTHEEAMEIIDSLFVNNINDLIALFKIGTDLIKRGHILPFIIVDDTAVIMDKYKLMAWAPKEEREVARAFVRMYQIIREGVGCLILISAPGMMLKPIRNMQDIIYESFTISDTRTWTMWLEIGKAYTVIGPRPGIESPIVRQSKALLGITATIHPPMLTPPEFYNKLGITKMENRKQIMDEILRKSNKTDKTDVNLKSN
ncbi:MAG: hypothetical protein QXM12_07445 [Nitrososphaerota archaeon]